MKKQFQYFLSNFMHPRVFVFMLLGVLIIFLTFFTDNNAAEIAISAVASVFIGIGVNNLTSLEIHKEDDKKLKSKIGHSLKVMSMAKAQIARLYNEVDNAGCNKIKNELAELEQFMNLGISLMQEDSSLN